MRYETRTEPTAQELYGLYQSVQWFAYLKPEILRHLIPNATWYCGAWDGDDLVGLVRVISDDVSIAYIQDLLVRPDHQRDGIGSTLMRRALHRFAHCRQTFLLTDDKPENARFYQYAGLDHCADLSTTAYVRIRG